MSKELLKDIITEFCTKYLNTGNNQVGVIISHDKKAYSGVPFKTCDELIYSITSHLKITKGIVDFDANEVLKILLDLGIIFDNAGHYFTNSVINYKSLTADISAITSSDIEKEDEEYQIVDISYLKEMEANIINRINSVLIDQYNKISVSLFEIEDKMLPTDKQKAEDGYSLVEEIKKLVCPELTSSTIESHIDISSMGIQNLQNNPLTDVVYEEE
jgi:hypothetical protein